jgi:hypothetical protein
VRELAVLSERVGWMNERVGWLSERVGGLSHRVGWLSERVRNRRRKREKNHGSRC